MAELGYSDNRERAIDDVFSFVGKDDDRMAILSHYLHNGGVLGGGVSALPSIVRGYLTDRGINDLPESDDESGLCDDFVGTYGNLFDAFIDVPFAPPVDSKFTFIDLFAGIGGFRIALQNVGGRCVYSSEWDLQAQRTYFANFGEVPFGDITKPQTKRYIPRQFDVLCAGFPCQPFSISGKQKGF